MAAAAEEAIHGGEPGLAITEFQSLLFSFKASQLRKWLRWPRLRRDDLGDSQDERSQSSSHPGKPPVDSEVAVDITEYVVPPQLSEERGSVAGGSAKTAPPV